jgi:hypothetical protein
LVVVQLRPPLRITLPYFFAHTHSLHETAISHPRPGVQTLRDTACPLERCSTTLLANRTDSPRQRSQPSRNHRSLGYTR